MGGTTTLLCMADLPCVVKSCAQHLRGSNDCPKDARSPDGALPWVPLLPTRNTSDADLLAIRDHWRAPCSCPRQPPHRAGDPISGWVAGPTPFPGPPYSPPWGAGIGAQPTTPGCGGSGTDWPFGRAAEQGEGATRRKIKSISETEVHNLPRKVWLLKEGLMKWSIAINAGRRYPDSLESNGPSNLMRILK